MNKGECLSEPLATHACRQNWPDELGLQYETNGQSSKERCVRYLLNERK